MSLPAHLHLSVKTISRRDGRSVRAMCEYMARRGRFAKRKLDRCLYVASFNMPLWASHARHAPEYWKAADDFERVNGRLAQSFIHSLPRGLNSLQRRQLAEDYALQVARTADGRLLPCTLAIHSGRGTNPHVHLLVSERINDGTDRSPALWFRREAVGKSDKKDGGAPKTRDLMSRDWIPAVRKLLADLTNAMLLAAGRPEAELVDHRSYHERGVDIEPGRHFGPAAMAMHRSSRGRRVDEIDKERRAAAEALHEARLIHKERARAERHLRDLRAEGLTALAFPSLAEIAAHNQAAAASLSRMRSPPVPSPRNGDSDDDPTP